MTNPTETFHPTAEKYGSDAFRLEYSPFTPAVAIQKDLESFLGEYVFKLTEYNYELAYEDGMILDPITKETMIGKTLKAIRLREEEGKSTTREEAELGGFARLQHQLVEAKEGDVIVWLSPPGQLSEGYGEYGFVYLGEIKNLDRLSMTAIRVEQPKLTDYSYFLSALEDTSFTHVIEENFIAWPLVISDRDIQQVHSLISLFFTFKREGTNNAFSKAIEVLSPYINKYLEIVQTGGSKAFEQEVFNTLLNYSLDLKKRFAAGERNITSLPFYWAIERYGTHIPILSGSCGSIGSSNDIFNSLNSISRILNPDTKIHWDYHDGNCVVCNKKSTEVGPCSICKECEKKFD